MNMEQQIGSRNEHNYGLELRSLSGWISWKSLSALLLLACVHSVSIDFEQFHGHFSVVGGVLLLLLLKKEKKKKKRKGSDAL